MAGTLAPIDLETRYRERLEVSGMAVEAYRDSYRDEVEVRDAIILEAIDAGCLREPVARWARLTTTRVTQIIAARAAERDRRALVADIERLEELEGR